MYYQLITQLSPSGSDETLLESLTEIAQTIECDQVYIATAYATVGGVRKLLTMMTERVESFESNWLLGLDDYITQPGALELCLALPSASLRVASFTRRHKIRFHPKIILLASSRHPQKASLIIGSSNLTANGLSKNIEASMVVSSNSIEEATELRSYWQKYWELGNLLSTGEFENYARTYQEIKSRREEAGLGDQGLEPHEESNGNDRPTSKRTSSKRERRRKVLEQDSAEIDPSLASTCWIEVGNITGKGVELEFTAEQALFFGLSPHGGESEYKVFVLSDGSRAKLKLKYQENSMWRLQMNNSVPEVAAGLRPRSSSGKLLRSPFVAVFKKLPRGAYELQFIDDDSDSYFELCEVSKQHRTFGSTSARNYGWF
jgi:HKD family nuclease